MDEQTWRRAWEAGKAVVRERWGPFDETPTAPELAPGMMDQGMAAGTQMTIPTEDGETGDPQPHTILVDRDLRAENPKRAVKSGIAHELLEWRASEMMTAEEVWDGDSDTVAEFNENQVCREINARVGEDVCEVDWNSRIDS